ncbi:hypothetical protein Clacol_009317 [Clathrus columnatus]|uniref:BHLH domain-containing protein n=1 Tax=Clathrus columnatus TaxID=1419009 RepID=A0AAV5AMT3_9AGAM|nr:hypothetical protein Clacol_009317 [Clathrus columnatus]
MHHGVVSVTTDFNLVDYMVNHEADQSELDIFADFHQRSPVENMSMDSTQMLIDSSNSQNKQQMSNYVHNQSQHIHSQHHQQQQQQQQHQHQHQQQQHQQTSQLPQHRQQTQLMTAEMLDLKDRLEQQMKLQQLQQLLLQQQIDLLSGATQSSGQHLSSSHHQKDDDMFGLLTPGPSTDLPAMVPKELVPPMMLQSDMFLGSPATSLTSHHPDGGPVINPNPSFSAPAALAFPTTSPFSLPTDFSPISSPWIHPHNSQPQHDLNSQALLPLPLHPPSQQSTGHAFHPNISRPQLKRVGSVDDHIVDHHPPRKRSLRATPTSSSVSSTPISVPIPNSSTYYYPTNDTPSPVDLSMTAPPLSSTSSNSPSNSNNDPGSSNTGNGDTTSIAPPPPTPIAPMTPASILNLRSRFSTGLMTSTQLPISNNVNFTAPVNDQKETPNKKSSAGKVKVSLPSSTVTGRGRKGSVATLKPLLPGTQPPTPTSPLSLPTNPAGSSATGAPRKSSHKVAEQKRRDSLKTSFDELRLLLPPVALPEDEELLPGCMPPRGPPKGDADGPNRGVSKLALLRCGNAYIKELKGMVQRRDSEITLLRDEIRRLRLVVGDQDTIDGYPDGEGGSTSRIDIEKDVDEGRQIEAGIRFGMNANGLSSVQEEGDDDD